MTDTPPSKHPRPETTEEEEARRDHKEECLDEALDETFPASDPIAPQVPDKRG
jgi:hypothetical protein